MDMKNTRLSRIVGIILLISSVGGSYLAYNRYIRQPDTTIQCIKVAHPVGELARRLLQDKLQAAVQNNNLPTIQTLLEKGADPGSSGSQDQHSALTLAIAAGHPEIAQRLLPYLDQATFNTAQRAIFYASRQGDLRLLEQLLTFTQHTSTHLLPSHSPATECEIYQAIEYGHLAVAQRLLDLRPNCTQLLETALQHGQIAIAQWLLAIHPEWQARLTQEPELLDLAVQSGQLPLLQWLEKQGVTEQRPAIAARYGHVELLRYYYAHGNPLQAVDNETLAQIAARYNQQAVIRYLQSLNIPLEPTTRLANSITCPSLANIAVEAGHTVLLEWLLKQPHLQQVDLCNGDSLLHSATRRLDITLVDTLLKHGLAQNVRNEQGDTPLHLLSTHYLDKHAQAIFTLLLDNTDNGLNVQNNEGLTPLLSALTQPDPFYPLALLNAHAETRLSDNQGRQAIHYLFMENRFVDTVLPLLIEQKIDINAQDYTGKTPLHYAAAESVTLDKTSESLCNKLLVYKPLLDVTDQQGQTPLHIAVQAANINTLKALLTAGANPNIADEEGNTPLHLAAMQNDTQLLDALLKHHANIHLANQSGKTPLALSANTETLARLQASGATLQDVNTQGESILAVFTRRPDKQATIPLLKLLLAAGADINAGQPLHLAIRFNAPSISAFLLDAGINTKMVDQDGNTALHIAVRSRSLMQVQMLLKHHVEINTPNRYGRTALQQSIDLHESALANLLLQAGADFQTKDRDQRTPLHTALATGQAALASKLIELGADVNARSKGEWTPLHFAAHLNNPELIKQLLAKGAIGGIRTWGDQTALDIAKLSGNQAVIALLTTASSVFPTNNDGFANTPLHWAARNLDSLAVEKLIKQGIAINASNRYGETPLQLAVRAASYNPTEALNVIQILIRSGANVQVKDGLGNNLLHDLLQQTADIRIVELLLTSGVTATARNHYGQSLYESLPTQNLAVIQKLWQMGEHPHLWQWVMRHPQSRELTQWLLTRGESPNSTDELAIAEAILAHQYALLEPLRQAGGQLKKTPEDISLLTTLINQNDTEAALHLVQQSDYAINFSEQSDQVNAWLNSLSINVGNAATPLIKVLLEHGAKPYVQISTLLQAAVTKDAEQLLQLYQQLGFSVTNTAGLIHDAARYNAVRSLVYLQQQGLSLDAIDNAGDTPLHHAMRGQALAAVEWLVNHGANTQIRNQQQQSVLDQLALLDAQALLKDQNDAVFIQQIHALMPQASVSEYLLTNLIQQSRYAAANALLIAWADTLQQLPPTLNQTSPLSGRNLHNVLQLFVVKLAEEKTIPASALTLLDTIIKQGGTQSLILAAEKNHETTEYLLPLAARFPDVLKILLAGGYQINDEAELQALVNALVVETDTASQITLAWLLQQPNLPRNPDLLKSLSNVSSEANPSLTEKYQLLRHFVDLPGHETPFKSDILRTWLANETLCNTYADIILTQIQQTEFSTDWLTNDKETTPFLIGLMQPKILAALQQQTSTVKQLQHNALPWIIAGIKTTEDLVLLQKHGIDLTQVDKMGNNLLLQLLMPEHVAELNEKKQLLPIVDFLLVNYPALAQQHNQQGEQALHLLLNSSLPNELQLRLVQRLRKANASLDVADKQGNTPLHRAIQQQQWGMVEWLLNQTQSYNSRNQQGETALHLLVDAKQNALIKTLLTNGGDANITDNNGNTALHRLVSKPCIESNCHAEREIFQQLVTQKTDINRLNADGEIPLFLCAYSGNALLAELLLANQADPNIPNRLGEQALQLALYYKAYSLADLLITHGAALDKANWEGVTAIDSIKKTEDAGLAALVSEKYTTLQWSTAVQNQQAQADYLYTLLINKRLLAANAIKNHQKLALFRSIKDNNTLLHAAALANDSAFVQLLLSKQYPLTATNANGETALTLAIQAQANQVTPALLSAGAPLPEFAAILATKTNSPETLQKLIDSSRSAHQTLDLNLIDQTGKMALHYAIAQDNALLVKTLLDAGAKTELPSTSESKQDSALLLAVEKGNLAIVEALLKAGSNTQTRNAAGRTALLQSIWYFTNQAADTIKTDLPQRLKLLDLLIAHGATVNEYDTGEKGNTALHIGIPVYGIAQYLLEKGANIHVLNKEKETAFFQAVRAQYPEQDMRAFLIRLLDAGIDLNARNLYGETALQAAIRHNNEIALTLLLERGADPNVIKNVQADNTAYSLTMYVIASPYIAEERKIPLLELLNKAGADLKAINTNGENALFIALRGNKQGLDIAQWLLKHGVSAQIANDKGQTPLHTLVEQNGLIGVKPEYLDALLPLFIQQGLDLQTRDMNSQTALHYAVKYSQLAWVKRLLQAGIDPNIQDNADLTALHIALNKPPAAYPNDPNGYNPADIQLLLDFKADPNRRNALGQTALHLSYAKQHPEWVQPFLAAGANPSLRSYLGKLAEEEMPH